MSNLIYRVSEAAGETPTWQVKAPFEPVTAKPKQLPAHKVPVNTPAQPQKKKQQPSFWDTHQHGSFRAGFAGRQGTEMTQAMNAVAHTAKGVYSVAKPVAKAAGTVAKYGAIGLGKVAKFTFNKAIKPAVSNLASHMSGVNVAAQMSNSAQAQQLKNTANRKGAF